jgi:small-conductance mechanosensitive channel
MQIEFQRLLRSLSRETALVAAIVVLAVGLVLAYYVRGWIHRVAGRLDITRAVEGTPFERAARNVGTSTVGIVAWMAALFVYVGAVILALQFVDLVRVELFWSQFTSYLPRVFVAVLALIVGLIAGDKARLVVNERLRSVKLPEAGLIPELVRYSIVYIATLIALGQVGVDTLALLVLLAAYAFGLVFLSAVAFKNLLAASAAGIYVLLAEPYAIGNEVEIDGKRGIVQEINVFVTHIESDGQVYVVPNQHVLRTGVTRFRD